MRVENGRAVPSEAPGLGIAWDLDAIERMSIASGKIVARA